MVALERRTVETWIPGYARRNRQTVMYDFSDVSSSYYEGADTGLNRLSYKSRFNSKQLISSGSRRWDESRDESPLFGQR
jgi:hypothetical protein